MLRNKIYILLTFASLFLVFLSCSETKTTYTVTGKLKNVKDSVFFAARETGDSLFVDTIRINNKGEFKFKGSVDTLTIISLYFKESAASPYILVDKGWEVEVSGDIHMPDLIMTKGGEINNDLTDFKNDNIDLLKSRLEIVNHKDDLAEKTDSIASKEYIVDLKNINFELLNIASNYIKAHPTKIASVILINNFFKNEESQDRLNESLDELRGVAHDFPLAVQLREYRDKLKKSSVGSYAPAFEMADTSGKKVRLADYRRKYLLISFVSTTCGLCDEMQPTVIKEHEVLKKEKMNIEFISIFKDVEEKAISADTRKQIKWTIIPEYGGWSSKIFEEYNIKELPYNILIGKDGKILERNISAFNLKNRLEAYSDIRN